MPVHIFRQRMRTRSEELILQNISNLSSIKFVQLNTMIFIKFLSTVAIVNNALVDLLKLEPLDEISLQMLVSKSSNFL